MGTSRLILHNLRSRTECILKKILHIHQEALLNKKMICQKLTKSKLLPRQATQSLTLLHSNKRKLISQQHSSNSSRSQLTILINLNSRKTNYSSLKQLLRFNTTRAKLRLRSLHRILSMKLLRFNLWWLKLFRPIKIKPLLKPRHKQLMGNRLPIQMMIL